MWLPSLFVSIRKYGSQCLCQCLINCSTILCKLGVSLQVEGQLFELEQLQQQQPLLQEATTTLEDLLGSTALPDFHHGTSEQAQPVSTESLPARLEAAAETASLVVAELQSIHRQHVTTGLLLQQEEARSKQLEAELVQAKVWILGHL